MWRRSSGSRFPCAMSANLPRHGLGVRRRRAVGAAVCVRLTARRAGAAGTRGVPDERDMPRTHWWPGVVRCQGAAYGSGNQELRPASEATHCRKSSQSARARIAYCRANASSRRRVGLERANEIKASMPSAPPCDAPRSCAQAVSSPIVATARRSLPTRPSHAARSSRSATGCSSRTTNGLDPMIIPDNRSGGMACMRRWTWMTRSAWFFFIGWRSAIDDAR